MLPLELIISKNNIKKYERLGIYHLEDLVCYNKAQKSVLFNASIYILAYYTKEVKFMKNTILIKKDREKDYSNIDWNCVIRALLGESGFEIEEKDDEIIVYIKQMKTPKIVMPDLAKIENNIYTARTMIEHIRDKIDEKIFQAKIDEKITYTQIVVLNPWVVRNTLRVIKERLEKKSLGAILRSRFTSIAIKKLPFIAKLYTKSLRYKSLRKYSEILREIIELSYEIATLLEKRYTSSDKSYELLSDDDFSV